MMDARIKPNLEIFVSVTSSLPALVLDSGLRAQGNLINVTSFLLLLAFIILHLQTRFFVVKTLDQSRPHQHIKLPYIHSYRSSRWPLFRVRYLVNPFDRSFSTGCRFDLVLA